MKKLYQLLALAGICSFISCNNNTSNDMDTGTTTNTSMAISGHSIVASFPHDTSSFTEGLLIYKGNLYESTGNYGSSKLLHIDLKTGKPVMSISLDPKYFGEGLTILNDTAYQLTWKEHTVFVYDIKTFKKIKEFTNLNPEGWGLTNDGKNLIATDGSNNLYFYEPATFRLLKTQGVTENGNPIINLNEVEYIDGFIYANQWQENYIYKIDPNSGQVVAKYDFTNLVNQVRSSYPQADVLNGIAYDA
ncbi:MAG: glutamine cyclotransferase, partial [Chitinophagaceae bacterium]